MLLCRATVVMPHIVCIFMRSFTGLVASFGYSGVYHSGSGVKRLGGGHGEGLDGAAIECIVTMIGWVDGEGCMRVSW